MVTVACVDPCPPNPVTPIPGVVPPPAGTPVDPNPPTPTSVRQVEIVGFQEVQLMENETLMAYSVPAADAPAVIPANFEGSTGDISDNVATGMLDILLNGAEIGQIDVSGGTVVFIGAGNVTLVENDLLTVVAANEIVATLLAITIVARTSAA